MKKLLSMTIAVIMVLAVFPFTALNIGVAAASGVQSTAATDDQITSNVCTVWYDKDGVETALGSYNTIDLAMEAMSTLYKTPLADETIVDTNGNGLSDELYEAAGSPVIKLNGNHQGKYARPNWCTTSSTYNKDKVITFVIDGAKSDTENYTITYGTADAGWGETAFNYMMCYNLTVKNTNMVINRGSNTADNVFCWFGRDFLAGESFSVFENCYITETTATTNTDSGGMFKINGYNKANSDTDGDGVYDDKDAEGDKANLIFKDTTVETALSLGVQVHWGADANIELYNSTWALTSTHGKSNNNDAMIKYYEAGDGYVYIDGTSKLISRRTGTGTVALFRNLSSQGEPVEIVLEKGAELRMENTGALTTRTYLALNGKNDTVEDRGALYYASQADVVAGVTLTADLSDWSVGAGVPIDTSTSVIYKNADATGAVNIFATAPWVNIKNDTTGETPAGLEYTDTINEAFDWVYSQTDSANYTIYLNNNASTSACMYPLSYDNTNVRTVKINGNGNTLTSTNGTAMFYGMGLYNLTLTDIDLIAAATNSLDWSPRLTASDDYNTYDVAYATDETKIMVDSYHNFTNVTFTPYDSAAGTLKLKGGNSATAKATYHITMTDCVFNCNSADTMFMMNTGATLDLDVIGTQIIYRGGASNNDGNNYIFALNGAAVDINVENSENNISVIDSDSQSTRVTSGIFNNGTGYTVNVTLGADVELKLGANDYKTTAKFFLAEKTTTTITDNGARWTVKANLLDNNASVTLPTTMFTAGTNDHIWYANGVIASVPYVNPSVANDVDFTHVEYSDDIQTEYENICYVKTSDGTTTYYTSISGAITALGDLYSAVTTENITDNDLWVAAGSPIIYVYRDIVITSEIYPSWYASYDANRVRTVIIKSDKADGTNASITSTNAGAAFGYNAYYNMTLENIDLTCTAGFAIFWRGYNNGNMSVKSTTNMINCNISATGTTGEGLVFKVTGNQNQTKTENYIINITNTNVTAEAGVNAVFLFHHGNAGTLNIDGTSSIHHVQDKQTDGGDTMFMLGTNRTQVINVASGAELSVKAHNVRTTGAYANTYAIFRMENSNNYASADAYKNIINIEDGVKITLDAASDYTGAVCVVDNNTTLANNGTDLNIGAIDLTVTATAASKGFGFITGVKDVDNKTPLGCYINGGTELYNTLVPAGKFNEEITEITMAYLNEGEFGMADGASLRTVHGENGIRFSSFVSDELKAVIEKYASYGTVIAPGTTVSNDPVSHAAALTIPSTKMQTGSEFGDNVFHAAVIMPDNVAAEKVYSLSLVARSYILMTYADGSEAYFYTDITTENIRSMSLVAHNLANKNAENYDNNVISNIVSLFNPYNLLQHLAGVEGKTALQSSTTCQEMVFTGLTAENGIIERLIEIGWTEVSTDQIAGSKFETTILENSNSLLTFYWDEAAGEMRVMSETKTNNATAPLTPNDTTGTGTIDIAQIGMERSTASIAEDGTITYGETDNPLNGMCYIVKLSDGSAMIIDGGFSSTECSDNLFNALKTMGIATDESGKYIITAWIFTHGHGDHIGTIQTFAPAYKDNIDVKYVVYNIPNSSAVAGTEGAVTAFESAIATNFPSAQRINPHAGLKYYFGNASVDMLYVPELLYSEEGALDYYNNTSLIFKVEANGASALFMGDAGEKAAERILGLYESSTFASNILQISHHGLYTEASSGHTWTNIKTLYDATGADYAFLPMHSQYDGLDADGNQITRNGRYTVMIGWGIENGYQMSYVMNENDTNTAFGSRWDSSDILTQDQFEQFIAEGQVTSNNNTLPTTVTVSTVYGYDGINKVTNENGMVTYIGSNDTTPMATIFTLGNDAATLTTNDDFYTWSGTVNPYA